MTPHDESTVTHAWAALKRLARRLSAIVSTEKVVDEEGLRASFREACGRFKRLVSANNKALEAMSHMEETLAGSQPYDLAYVRTQTTRIVSAVYQMVEALDTLAPGRYSALRMRFESIRAQLVPLLETAPGTHDGTLVIPFSDLAAADAPRVGGKAANLGEMRNRADLPVSDGFAVTAQAFWLFMRHTGLDEEVDRQLRLASPERLESLYGTCSRIRQKIVAAPLPPELHEALNTAAQELALRTGSAARLAVRSSALGEDSMGHAFAGQYRSMLNVPSEHLAEAWREVVASKYGVEAVAYRMRRGLADRDVAVSVAVMPMLGAVAGGVLYTRDPVTMRADNMVIHAVQGLPRGVVDGSLPTDRFSLCRVPPHAILSRQIAYKSERYAAANGEGVTRLDTPPDMASAPALTDAQLHTLAGLSMRVEQHYGIPQDVEWALLDNGEFRLLQARPILFNRAARAPEAAPPLPEGTVVLLQGGETASPGTACGPVVQVRKQAEALGFPDNAVLAVPHADTRWAPLLSRAAAVVAGTGSSAGHLANVAREFGIPALFGVGWKVDTLKTGTVVTVDADAGQVLEGRIESLLADAPAPRNIMEGSSVHTALSNVLAHIAPLTLTDSESPDFRPENCQTLHDITRFCHQKAVEEMFRSDDGGYPRHMAKQLYLDRPLQFWVVNLDDGFLREPQGKLIPLEDIGSPPMHALWHGMMHVPWAGPPPVHLQGFLSLLAQSASTPGFEPAGATDFTIRNYFLVSSRFCSLQSRFGYHFCTVETLAGDVDAENFVAFRFKGGAADINRRLMRVRLIAEILEEYGLRTRIIRDSLSARLEGLPMEETLRALRVMGHLVMHTRQLDMIMSSPDSVVYYKEKLGADIRTVLAAAEQP